MISGSEVNLLTGGASYGLSTVASIVGYSLRNAKEEKERRLTQEHAEKMALMKATPEFFKLESQDADKARAMNGSFVSATRRMIALSAPLLFILIGAAMFLGKPVSTYLPTMHHFLGFDWKSYKVLTLNGLVFLPWFQQWCFMIGGFYFGRVINK